MRRHYANHDAGIAQCIFETVGCNDGLGNEMARQEEIIHVACVDALADFRFMRPQDDLVCALAAQHDGDGRSPCSSANNGDLTHKKPLSAKTIFGAREQTPDVVFVPNDDEQGTGGEENDCPRGSDKRIQPPRRKRKNRGGEDAAQ
jgi:hypothetical protein